MPAAGSTVSADHVGVLLEQPAQALVGPAPVVDRRRVVDLDPVRRGEHPPAGPRDPAQLADGLSRVVAVLEHLGAEDDVERRVLDRQRLDRAEQLGCRILDDVDADVLGRGLREERVVRLDAAADVEDAHLLPRLELGSLRPQPRGQRATHDPRRRADRWVSPLRARPLRELVRHRASVTPYGSSFWKAANAGFFLPAAVSRPDCQPAIVGSSLSRNQSIMSMRGFACANLNAWVRYCACFAYETPISLSGGLVW